MGRGRQLSLAGYARFSRHRPLTGGEAAIEARKGKLTVKLKVSVHPKRTFKVAFFFLQDKDTAGSVKPRTAFAPSQAKDWIDGLNEVFGLQANIWFKNGRSELLPITDLSSAVGSEQDLKKLAEAHKTSGMPIEYIFCRKRD